MKRQIFWLIFSCFTATTFLSHSMEEKDFDTQEKADEAKEQTLVPARMYPAIPAQNNEQEKQSILGYICEKSQVIDQQKLEDFLGAQVLRLIKMLNQNNADWDKFFSNAFNSFLSTVIDREKTTELYFKLQEAYLPEMFSDSIEDTRICLVILLILEKAVEYAENAAEISEEDNIWNEDLTKKIIEIVSSQLKNRCHDMIEKYQEEYPFEKIEDEKSSTKKAAPKKLAIKTTNQSVTGLKCSPEAFEIMKKLVTSLQARIKKLEKELNQKSRLLKKAESAQPASNNIRLLQGAVLGIGSCFIADMLAEPICDYSPMCIDLDPSSNMTSILYATLGLVATTGSLYYINSSKTIKVLFAKLLTQSSDKAFKAYLTIKQLREWLKKKQAKIKAKKQRHPWYTFEDSLEDKQNDLIQALPDEVTTMLEGACDNKPKEIKAFLAFYQEYLEYKQAKTKRISQTNKFKAFDKFMKSIEENQNQKELFDKAIEYLENLASGEKEA